MIDVQLMFCLTNCAFQTTGTPQYWTELEAQCMQDGYIDPNELAETGGGGGGGGVIR